MGCRYAVKIDHIPCFRCALKTSNIKWIANIAPLEQIKNFFEQVGLEDDQKFDAKMVEIAKNEIAKLHEKHSS